MQNVNRFSCNECGWSIPVTESIQDVKCPECGSDMTEWTFGMSSAQFCCCDKRMEREPRFDVNGVRINNPFTYHTKTVMEGLLNGLTEYSIQRNDVIDIQLKTIEDGSPPIYMIIARVRIKSSD